MTTTDLVCCLLLQPEQPECPHSAWDFNERQIQINSYIKRLYQSYRTWFPLLIHLLFL